jgi:predicted SnoaL-like aldol condensation-catalyzing enzyme
VRAQKQNKAIVREAFDTLFNKRDYIAAARSWSPNYVQHSAHIQPAPSELAYTWLRSLPSHH